LTTVRRHDFLNRLQGIQSTPAGTNQPAVGFAYQYNAANQRTVMTLADASYWLYRYDTLGQVVSGKRYWVDGTPVPGQQNEYGFDDIGNRTGTKVGGDDAGGNLRSATYSANLLNQYSNRTVPGVVEILGLAAPTASVTVNGNAADFRRGEYFEERLSVSNSTTAVWQSVSVSAGGTAQTGNVFVPPATETFTYDADGNLTTDGRWTYTWDAENRLVQMQSRTNTPSGSWRKLVFEYDAQSRRIAKQVHVWNGTAYPGTPNTSLKFVYDGWNLGVELNGSNAVVRSYQWGTDLSGSLQGAGGVGGLVSVKPAGSAAQFVAYDGNGNVMALVDGVTGSLSATYEYGPFGEVLRQSGAQAGNPVRFSSKYQDEESGLNYYGYRYYAAGVGRWLGRDPIEEGDGPSNYVFLSNDALRQYDVLGLTAGSYPDDFPVKSSAFDPNRKRRHDSVGFTFEVHYDCGKCPCKVNPSAINEKGAERLVRLSRDQRMCKGHTTSPEKIRDIMAGGCAGYGRCRITAIWIGGHHNRAGGLYGRYRPQGSTQTIQTQPVFATPEIRNNYPFPVLSSPTLSTSIDSKRFCPKASVFLNFCWSAIDFMGVYNAALPSAKVQGYSQGCWNDPDLPFLRGAYDGYGPSDKICANGCQP
jgi:RHS repeat-associated protein